MLASIFPSVELKLLSLLNYARDNKNSLFRFDFSNWKYV